MGLCGAMIFQFASKPNRRESITKVCDQPARESLVISSMSRISTSVAPVTVSPSIAETNALTRVVSQKELVWQFSPNNIGYKPTINVGQADVLLPIIDAVNNAVTSVDRGLKSKNYIDVKEFNRTVWLESVDKAQSTLWRIIPDWKISPEGTNAVVGAIEAIVYKDPELTQIDNNRSFQMEFYSGAGSLRNFFWADKHEMLIVEANGMTGYSKNLGEQKRLVMGWDTKGGLISSNVYDWATRGRVISGWTVTNTPIYADKPVRPPHSKSGR